MTEALLKRYPKKINTQKKKQYGLAVGQEAYAKKEPKVKIEIRKVEKER